MLKVSQWWFGTGKSYICQGMVGRKFKVVFKRRKHDFWNIIWWCWMKTIWSFRVWCYGISWKLFLVIKNIYRRIKQFVEQNKQNIMIPGTGDCKWLTQRIMKLRLMMSVIISDRNHRRTQQTVVQHRTWRICLKKTDLLMTWLKNILDTLTTQRR